MSAANKAFDGASYGMEITLDLKKSERFSVTFSRIENNIQQMTSRNHLGYVLEKDKIYITGKDDDLPEFALALSLLVQNSRLRPFYTDFVFYDFTEDGFGFDEPMDARQSYDEWIEGLNNSEQRTDIDYRSDYDMKRMNNKIYMISALCTALLCFSSCGNYDSKAEDVSTVDTLTTVITTSVDVPEIDDDLESSYVIEFEGKENDTATDRKSEGAGDLTEKTELETDDRKSETEEAGKETEATTAETELLTEEDKEKPTTTTKKAVTTTRKAETTTTTTKKLTTTTTTTAKKATTTTTTTAKKTTTTTTTTTVEQEAQAVEWSRLMLAYKHYAEAIFDVMDSMDYYDKKIFTNEDVELVRKDICDYLYNTFNGKQVITINTQSGIKTLDFLRPLELTIDTSLRCWQEGTWVLGDAHLNTGTGIDWISRKAYNAMTEKQKYEYIVKRRSECFESAANCLYVWYWYAEQNDSLKYAYELTFNYGIDNAGEYWFLNR